MPDFSVESTFFILGEPLMRAIVFLAKGGWPDGDAALRGRGLCSSEDLYVQVRAAEPWNSFETGGEDRPSRPDFADTRQVTHRDWWFDNFWCLIRSEVSMMFVCFGCSCFVII